MTAENYVMPAEWEPHQRCWMAWPQDHGDWPIAMPKVLRNFVQIAEAIASFEPLQMLADPSEFESVRRRVPGGVEVVSMELDDCWMRDMGPTMVRDSQGQLCGVDWGYNGWGKFPHERDQYVARRLLKLHNIPVVSSALINEGGAIHVDGEGTCVLTETVLLNANRNPGLTKAEAEKELRRTLGAEQIIWLPRGLVDDDTDGHIDEIMCFTRPGAILLLTSSDPSDANYGILQEAREILAGATDAKGRKLQMQTLEQPPAAYLNGARLSRSYVNCYIANRGVVMPAYGASDFDQEARVQIQRAFPDREVIQLDCSALVTGGGNIHCITQQCPQG